ncbi:MAG TPA: hypothetical protein VIK29_10255 [Paludibacter sp.]
MESPTPSKSLSQCMAENDKKRKQREEMRFYELEELIIDTPSTDPQWNKYIDEFNYLKSRI